ncbi:DUF2255 family protein [Actinoplanes bogorensis]|uniref:DUF2255 family protein n=1 Tax=Paractinoplanes bogorensis TaxID=1610840 RepID=A0ABS5Z421_9ACTN|nr:DUF2255 family protein [Actinoplanes bogorensis]MBU2670291.1 DUF2255 family protein [Actinoplanes bogorensis]
MSEMWTPADLRQIQDSDELEIAVPRVDGSLRKWTPIWVVRVGGEVFVRTWHRRDTGWYGDAVRSGRGRIRVPGVEAAVTVTEAGAESRAEVDEAYHSKYGRYGTDTVGQMVSDEAVASTLRLTRE